MIAAPISGLIENSLPTDKESPERRSGTFRLIIGKAELR